MRHDSNGIWKEVENLNMSLELSFISKCAFVPKPSKVRSQFSFFVVVPMVFIFDNIFLPNGKRLQANMKRWALECVG